MTGIMIAHIIPMCQRRKAFLCGPLWKKLFGGNVAEGMRLNKALADAGVCSRRRADEFIFSGTVRVNGQVVDNPGVRVMPGDRITLNGRPVELREQSSQACWIMLHKPVQVVSTASDPEGRETVLDLVPEPWCRKRLYPVGRLDYFSEGLLLLTDDGELAHRLTHPRWHLPKIYHVLVRPERGDESVDAALRLFRRGMTLSEGDRLAPVEVTVLPSQSRRGIVLEMVLHQGLNRQIRRMCRDVGFTVLRLMRVAEGPVDLGDLEPGRVRPLSSSEVSALRRAVGLEG